MADELLERYRDHLQIELRLSAQTVATYLRECEAAAAFAERSGRRLSDLDSSAIVDYLVQRDADGVPLEQRTLAKLLSALRSFYQFCILERLRTDNPAKRIGSPRVPHRLPGVLSVDQVDRLLDAIDTSHRGGVRDVALFELIYSCGLRISEAVGLDLGDLFLGEALIRVRGKGDKQRLVPVGETATARLSEYLTHERPHLAGDHSGDALFLNRRGARLSRKGMWKRFHEHAAAIGIEAKVHTLRHSFATHLLQGGADLRSVQELLGHADIGTTQIYTHVDREEMRAYHRRYHPRTVTAGEHQGARGDR